MDIHNQREIENLQAEIKRFRAENERLRSALKEVIECDPGAYEAAIARAAIGGEVTSDQP